MLVLGNTGEVFVMLSKESQCEDVSVPLGPVDLLIHILNGVKSLGRFGKGGDVSDQRVLLLKSHWTVKENLSQIVLFPPIVVMIIFLI